MREGRFPALPPPSFKTLTHPGIYHCFHGIKPSPLPTSARKDFEVSVPMQKTAFTVEITGTVNLLQPDLATCFENDKVGRQCSGWNDLLCRSKLPVWHHRLEAAASYNRGNTN